MKTHQIPIEAFTTALRLMGEEDVDNDETACIIANLIYEAKIKVQILPNITYIHKDSLQTPFRVTSPEPGICFKWDTRAFCGQLSES